METGSRLRQRFRCGRSAAPYLAAILLLAGCATSPDGVQTTDSRAFELYPTAFDTPETEPRRAYAPSLRQVAYQPYASDAALTQTAFLSDEVGETGDGDPLEGLNRYFLELNNALDLLIFRQFAEAYRLVVPDGVKRSVTNFVRFAKTPVILANDLLQGDLERAQITTSRFVVNAVIGAGFFDVASDSGLPYHEEDFGQTLAVHGVDSGPYIVLPLLGPSTARDGAGQVVDILLDPLTYVLPFAASAGRTGGEAVEARERNLDTLDEIRRDALDEYARIRSLWQQSRRDEILNSEATAAAERLSFLRSDVTESE